MKRLIEELMVAAALETLWRILDRHREPVEATPEEMRQVYAIQGFIDALNAREELN